MSEEKKESRFLQKWKLVRAAARDNKRLSTGDIAVLIALCDRYGSKYDPDAPALAGHSLLGAMSGLSRRATIDSTRRLIEAGYIEVLELGSGTRGTRYGLILARGEDETTTKGENSSSEAEFTTVVNPTAPLDPLSGEAYFTESPPTLSRLQARLDVVGNKFDATAAPPPADGQEATAAGLPSGDGFDEFWAAYPRKHGLEKAQAEWSKITSDVDIIIDVAADWAAHYRAHGTNAKWIPEPANWLRGRRWLEDLPLIHGDAKGAAISKSKANAPTKKSTPSKADIPEPEKPAPDFTVYPDRAASAVIRHAVIETAEDDGAKILTVNFHTTDGEDVQQMMVIESADAREQEDGQYELQQLINAVGLEEVHRAEEFIGRSVELMVTHRGSFVSCSRPWIPAPKHPRNVPKFSDVVNQTPMLGWSSKIGSSADDDEEEREAA